MQLFRSLLISIVSVALAACNPSDAEPRAAAERSKEPSPYEPIGMGKLDLFPSGIQVTDVTHQEARVTIRWTNDEATILELLRANSELAWELVESIIL